MAKQKPAAKKRDRAAGKTRDQLDVRANVVRKVKRMREMYGSPEKHMGKNFIYVEAWQDFADALIAYLSTMDTRANARRGGGGVR